MINETHAFTATQANGAGEAEYWTIYIAAPTRDAARAVAQAQCDEDGDFLLSDADASARFDVDLGDEERFEPFYWNDAL